MKVECSRWVNQMNWKLNEVNEWMWILKLHWLDIRITVEWVAMKKKWLIEWIDKEMWKSKINNIDK